MLQKLGGGVAVIGRAGDADAGIDADMAALEAEAARDRMDHALCQRARILATIIGHRLYDRKFVAAEPAHHVVFTEHGGNPRGHGHQQGVACRVSQRIVDGLEAVEIEQHDVERLA